MCICVFLNTRSRVILLKMAQVQRVFTWLSWILLVQYIHKERKIQKIILIYQVQLKNYDHQIYGRFSLDTEPLQFMPFWCCLYSTILNCNHLISRLITHFQEINPKKSLAKIFTKKHLWWNTKIIKITISTVFPTFSEGCKLISWS